MITKLGIYGCPSYYGGADTELYDQLYVWNKMGIELHLVPSVQKISDPIKKYVTSLAKVYEYNNFSAFKGMPVISFCNKYFLEHLELIRKYASYILWVNCMTWVFNAEREAHRRSLIDLHLFQTEHGKQRIVSDLQLVNPKIKYEKFVPYFNPLNFPYNKHRSEDIFCFGRISRDDASKFMKDTVSIYNLINSPSKKEAVILGYTRKQQSHVGMIDQSWIRAYPPLGISQQEFYKRVHCVVQTSECYENWPRVGLEAMYSGSVLVVYKNSGWMSQVIHGETGYLCASPKEFVLYTTLLAHYPKIRISMAERAFERVQQISGLSKSIQSWTDVFNKVG